MINNLGGDINKLKNKNKKDLQNEYNVRYNKGTFAQNSN